MIPAFASRKTHLKLKSIAGPLALAVGALAAVGCDLSNGTDANLNEEISTGERVKTLQILRSRLESKQGNGPLQCAKSTFAFDASKEAYEVDAFEIRAAFKGNGIKINELDTNDRCIETRYARPLVLLQHASRHLSPAASLSNAEELLKLGLNKSANPETGEVIVANFYHEKRFWIARIPAAKIKTTIFQLEHFDSIDPELLEKAPECLKKGLCKKMGDDALKWINDNVAGHTQVRVVFEKNHPVTLIEQVRKNNSALKPRRIQLHNIVLSSEAVGPEKLEYDPVGAVAERFFSMNRLMSLDEKYADMVIDKSHRVEQSEFNGSQAIGNEERVFATFVKMSIENWKSMTASSRNRQKNAFYKTIDPNRFQDKTKNCTTEVVDLYERACTPKSFPWNTKLVSSLFDLDDKFQKFTAQRAYPLVVHRVLRKEGFLTAPFQEQGNMDIDKNRMWQNLDPSLNAMRNRLAETEVCERYMNPSDKNGSQKCEAFRLNLK